MISAAISHSKFDVVNYLLDCEKALPERYDLRLHVAVKSGNVPLVEKLLASGIPIGEFFEGGCCWNVH